MRGRQFEDFSSLLESTCVDAGEDGLGAGGPHTNNLNIAHIINDKGDEALKKTIQRLQAHLPGDTEINKLKADISEWIAKEGAVEEEGTTNGVH